MDDLATQDTFDEMFDILEGETATEPEQNTEQSEGATKGQNQESDTKGEETLLDKPAENTEEEPNEKGDSEKLDNTSKALAEEYEPFKNILESQLKKLKFSSYLPTWIQAKVIAASPLLLWKKALKAFAKVRKKTN